MAKATPEAIIAALQQRSAAGGAPTTARGQRVVAALRRRGVGNAGPVTGGAFGRPLSDAEFKKRLDAALASVPQEPAKPNSPWAKGLGVVGKGLDFIDTPGSYVRSKISALATGIEEGDASKAFSAVPILGEAVNIVDNFGGDPNAPKGLLSKVIFADKQQEKDFWANTGTGEYLQRGIEKRGWEDTPLNNAWVKRGIGFAGDVGTDPLTYLSGGTKAVVQQGGKGAVVGIGKAVGEEGLEQGAKRAAQQGAKQVAKEGAEAGATTATKSVVDDAVVELAEGAVTAPKTKFKYARWTEFESRARDLAANTTDPLEREWALGAVERIRNARNVSVLSNSEVALLGGKRALFAAGKPVFENSKVLEVALRRREALGGAARRGANAAFRGIVKEGTFGNPAATKLLKGAMQAGGDEVARALDAIETEKWARHTSGIEATNLGREASSAVDSLKKLGVDEGTVFRTVQDETLFEQAVTANPALAEPLGKVRGVWRSMADAVQAETGKVLGGGETYAPHVLSEGAMGFLNKNPEIRKQIPGMAAFEKTRTLRSGQDDTMLLSRMESTKFYGKEIPRNLSDAQLVDWVNARFRQMAGVDFDLFETDIRKVIDRSVGNYATARHKSLFTTRMADRGWMGDGVRDLTRTMADPQARERFVAEQASDALRDVFEGANRTQAQVNFVNDLETFLKATKTAGKAAGRPWDEMVRELNRLKRAIAEGDVDGAVRLAERQMDVAARRARKAGGKLADLHQAHVDFLSAQIAKLRRVIADESFTQMRIAERNPGAMGLVADLQAGGGRFADAVRGLNEGAAQRARLQAERGVNVSAADQREADDLAYRLLYEKTPDGQMGPGYQIGVMLEGPRKFSSDPDVADFQKSMWTARVERAQEMIRAAVQAQGMDFVGFTGDVSKVTARDLQAKMREELLDQLHGRTVRALGENAYQKRMMRGVSEAANKVLGPLGRASDKIAQAKQALKQIPDPARYELMDLVGDNPRAAALFAEMTTEALSAVTLRQRITSGQVAQEALDDLGRRVGELIDALGMGDGQGIALARGQGVIASMKPPARAASDAANWPEGVAPALEKTTTGRLKKMQRDAARLAGEAVDETEAAFLARRIEAGMAEVHAKALADVFFNDDLAKGQRQPWRRTKNLSSRPTRQARQKARGVIGARERAIILQNENQIQDFVQNAFANTIRDSFGDLPGEVQELFRPMERFFKSDGGLKSVLDVYDKLNNSLKAWLIAKPGFVFRNLFGGVFVNMLAGVSPEAHYKMVKWRYADFLRQKGRPAMWNKLSDYDKLIYNSTREIQSSAETLVGSMVQRSANKSVASRFNPASPNFAYLAFNQGFNEYAENTILRGAMVADMLLKEPKILDALRAGDQMALRRSIRDTQVAATRKVGFFHFDYDQAAKSPFEREVLARVFPFYTYTKNVLPMLVAMMVERPKYFAWANAAANNLQLGVPEDEVLPEYIRESGAIRTPFTVGGNRVYWMQDLPFNQLVDIGNSPGNFVASSVSPLLKTPIELYQGKQFYKGIPITSDMKESRFQNVPVVSQLLSATGAQRTGNDGSTQFMRDDWQYALGQFVPPLYQTANYMPATETQELKWPTRVTSDLTGIRLRVNTPQDQENELARRNIKAREEKSKKTREKNRGYSGG